jgi:hypothetical protein
MPQFGLLLILVLLPLQMLSGGSTPRESMPEAVQTIMLAAHDALHHAGPSHPLPRRGPIGGLAGTSRRSP